MHIPDGYLSPSTCLTLTGVMLPFWFKATAKMKATIDAARAPFIAMGAVFVFIIMMFNIPIPNGTSGHAVGSVILAICLGPWAAVIATSIALLIQALLFGDGGILAFGANAFNMAMLMPFAGYFVYKLIATGAQPESARRVLAAGVGGYVGINAAALAAAIEFGLQPMLFVGPDGTPLYCPYGFSVAIPAMMVVHLTVVGVLEGVVTAAAFRFIARTTPELLPTEPASGRNQHAQ